MKAFLLALLSMFASLVALADDAKPWTFWYWMNGAVTKEGITRDLEAMAEIGLEGCYLMPVYGVDQAPELGGTVRQGSPEWWQMVDFALHEADRLRLKVGMHICDGFALAGGPWISPAQSMRMVTSTDTVISIGQNPQTPAIPLMPTKSDEDFQDIATYAIPLSYQPESSSLQPHISSDNPDFTIDNKGRIKCTSACTFTYTYDQPITVSALQITTYNNSLHALRMKVNGHQLTPPRHGWQNYDQPTTVSIPTVTTQQLTFEWTPVGTEKGSEDLDNAKWGKTLKIQDMNVIAAPRINDWEGKSGRIWRVSPASQNAISPEMYVPLDKVIRLTPETILPAGDWRIVRIGHISTGHTNATGGDCRGLECDKFSRSATLSQLNHWFGEAFQQCDSAMVHRVLKYMHVDSWECGSQNWSDSIMVMRNEELGMGVLSFAQYFELHRGYSLMPYLPLMVGIPIEDCETSERVLRDIRTTIAQLVNETFFPTLAEQAKRWGCKLSTESVAPTMVSDGMAHYRYADIPMGEFWLNSPTHDKPNDMLDAISGGHIYGKQIIQAEGFSELRGIFNEVPAQLKPLLDKQFCIGMNRLSFHVMTHNPDPSKKPGMTLNGIGLFFQQSQPWWQEGKSMVDYITRCQRLLQMGRPVVDIAVYTGHEMPRRAILPDRLQPLPGYHYDSFNYDALINPCESPFRPDYKVLLLPGARKLDPDHQPLPTDALSAIERLKNKGIKVVERELTTAQLDDMGLVADAMLPTEVLFAHRSLSQSEIYFIANQQNKARHISALLRDHRNLPAVVYYPLENTYHPIRYNLSNNKQAMIEIDLPAHGSCFVMFGRTEGKLDNQRREVASMPLSPTSPYLLYFEENSIKVSSDTLPDWSQLDNDSIRYYSGRVRYSFDFKFKPLLKKTRHYTIGINGTNVNIPVGKQTAGRIYLRLNELHDVATVLLNGKPCGAAWTSPYEIDVTDEIVKGKNHLEIWVANSWNNAILGQDSGHAPFGNIWTNAKYRNPRPSLLPAGLGPIEIIFKEEQER